MTYIKGNYRGSIYESDKGYIIGLFKIKETDDEQLEIYINKTITFTGYFDLLNIDENYIFKGEVIEHPKYGLQYKVNEFERIKPDDVDGIIEFLSSDLFKGIGEKLATKIVKILGKNTLNLILEDKMNLYKIPKISEKKVDIIYNTLLKYEESHKIVVYLTELGFTMKEALAIYNKYKDKTIIEIEYNIYNLIDNIDGINFIKIDSIAKNMNISLDDERRIEACIYYMITLLTYNNGDTYLTKDEICYNTFKFLKFEVTFIDKYLQKLEYEEKIIIIDDKYYLKEIYASEIYIAEKIKKLLKNKKSKYTDLDKKISLLEKDNGILYNDEQKEAIISSLENNITIITGGPGVGKTTIIKAIVDLYISINHLTEEEIEQNIRLLSPTGRASKRMSEQTFLKASTIHRFLKWDKENNTFGVNEYNKEYCNLVIIDEVSMIDTLLLESLFKGLTNNIKLVMVGDYNQLPSVGPGFVLKDMIDSNKIPVIKLERLYRQNNNSYIPVLAKEIKENDLSQDFMIPKDDFTFLECSSNSIRSNLVDICTKLIDKKYTYKRVQIMAPMYASINGIDNLNKLMQEVFNPKDELKKEIISGDVIFRENDKILQLVNLPDKNVYNGDIGIIDKIILAKDSESKKNEIIVNYDGNYVTYLPKDLVYIKHGYVISIHKSQGSEFEFVILPICNSYNRMLYKKIMYTAVTRAKRKLLIIGDKDAFIYSISNDNEIIRKTTLLDRLMNIN